MPTNPGTDTESRERLLALAQEDETVRAELMRTGELFDGYHPRMEAVHIANAQALAPMLHTGWPTVAAVGEDGQHAAWLIAQHAISLPPFQRKCLALLSAAVERAEAPAWQLAKLTDRIRVHEGRPQRYGTQFDWDANGDVSPLTIEDPSRVDELRARVDLSHSPRQRPVIDATCRATAQVRQPIAPSARQKAKPGRDAWAGETCR